MSRRLMHDHRPVRRRVSIVLAALCVAMVVAACGDTAPRPSLPVPTGAQPSAGFHGLVQFTGTPQLDNPYTVGGVIYLDWTTAEPVEGGYDWSYIDTQLALWAAHGKRAALRVTTSAVGRSATPDWVYSLGASHIDWPDGSVLPVYWNQTYVEEWTTFTQALARRYDGDPRILWYQAAIGIYGESKVDTVHGGVDPYTAWKKHGYTDRAWWPQLTALATVATNAFHRTQVAVAVDRSFIGGTPGYNESKVVDWLVLHSIWPQDNGLGPSTSYPTTSWNSNHLAEQLLSTSSTGNKLSDDIDAGLRTHATYIIVYGSDLANPVYLPVLTAAAQKVVS